MDSLLQDLRYALRSLARQPGFTTVAVLTLALGIGANTAIFSIVNGVLLKPLPYRDAGRVYMAVESSPQAGMRLPSFPTFVDWEAEQDVFETVGYTRGKSVLYRSPEGPKSLPTAFVSPRFFEALGLVTVLGRPLTAADARDGGRAVVLSHRLWRSWFGGDAGILGRSVTLGDASYAVVGVAAPVARYPDWAEAWVPLAAIQGSDAALTQRGFHADSRVIARLKPGVPLDRAQVRMSAIAARLAQAYPAEQAGWTTVTLVPLRFEVLGLDDSAETRLAVLAGAVALVLLIACANVTNLLLARALARGREMAIRMALGAGRSRVARQLLTETTLLAMAGAGMGVLLAFWCVQVIQGAAPTALPRLEEVSVDLSVLGFTAFAAILTALLVGLAPAMRGAPLNLTEALRSGGAESAGRAHRRLRRAIVTGEVALAVVLAVGAGLLIKSLWRLARVDRGFDTSGIVSIVVVPPEPRYPDARAAAEFYRRLHAAVLPVPGVRGAALMNQMPGSGAGLPSRITLPGEAASSADEDTRTVFIRTVTPDFLAMLRIPIRQGRAFAPADLHGTPVAILNATAARRFFPRGDPVGQTVTLLKSAQTRPDFGQPYQATIVGVAADVRGAGLGGATPAEVYVPYTVNPWGHMTVVVRAVGDPAALIPSLRRAILTVDQDIPIAGWGPGANFRTTAEMFALSLAPQRLNTGLLATFASAALLLAMIGIYGLMSYHVTQRTREIGLRIALGARPNDVANLVLREALVLSSAGVVLGLGGALAAGGVLRSLLYDTPAADPTTLASVALLLGAVAVASAYLPSRRAARVDPMVALRYE
jgi:putative ABC transport system permease protein